MHIHCFAEHSMFSVNVTHGNVVHVFKIYVDTVGLRQNVLLCLLTLPTLMSVCTFHNQPDTVNIGIGILIRVTFYD